MHDLDSDRDTQAMVDWQVLELVPFSFLLSHINLDIDSSGKVLNLLNPVTTLWLTNKEVNKSQREIYVARV